MLRVALPLSSPEVSDPVVAHRAWPALRLNGPTPATGLIHGPADFAANPANHNLPFMIPHDVGKILVVRLSARGDVAFASPLAGALRRRFPLAHIAWVAEDAAADVIRHNPHLDEVIVLERGAWRRMRRGWRWGELAGAVTGFFGALRERRFDVAIDAQGLLRSGLVTYLSGAPVRIGLGSREGSGRLMTAVVERGGDRRAISSEYRYLAGVLGLGTDPFPMEIPRSRTEVEAVERVIEEEGLAEGFVVACPFTTRFYKHWLEERWSSLIRAIPERTGLGVVLLGGPGDRAAADRILRGAAKPGSNPEAPHGASRFSGPEATTAPLVDLIGRTTLGEASAVVSRCRALVGVDTGLSHMAHAYGRPAVLIFGSNTPYLDPPGPSAMILHSGRACSPCRGKLTCEGRIDCMTDISVEQALAAVVACLEDGGAPGAAEPVRAATARRDTGGGPETAAAGTSGVATGR